MIDKSHPGTNFLISDSYNPIEFSKDDAFFIELTEKNAAITGTRL